MGGKEYIEASFLGFNKEIYEQIKADYLSTEMLGRVRHASSEKGRSTRPHEARGF
jgi:hypothetical protein